MQKLLLLVGLCVLVAHLEATCSQRRVCTSQRDPNFNMPSDMEPQLCTHIIFKSVRPNGAMVISSSGGPILDHEDFKIIPSPTTTTLLEVNLIEISSAIFAPSKRATFIASVIDVVDDENFDGVNILWMKSGSSNPVDKRGFTLLMQELKLELVGRLLTASVSGELSVIDDSYEVAKLAEFIDFFNVMTADLDRTSPSQFPNAIAGMDEWVIKGAPTAKLNMGIATYGVDTGSNANPRILPKYQVCAADTSLPNTVHVDSDATIIAKANHIMTHNFGGAFVTSLQLDDFDGVCNDGPFPVIQRVKNKLCPI